MRLKPGATDAASSDLRVIPRSARDAPCAGPASAE
jgi:hypothetical protein